MPYYFKVKKDKRKESRISLIAGNNEIVLVSEGHKTNASAIRSINALTNALQQQEEIWIKCEGATDRLVDKIKIKEE